MLLYAIYTPVKVNSWNCERVFAFASIERFIAGMRLVNEMGEPKGTLRPVTKEEAMEVSSMATLFTVSDKSDSFTNGQTVLISEDGVRDSWDGKWKKIHLVERIEDEKIPADVRRYA